MAGGGFFGGLAQALLDVFAPLRNALASPAAFEGFLRREGWQPPPVQTYFAAVSDAFKLEGSLENAATSIESLLDGDPTNVSALAAAIDALVKVLSDLRAIAKPGVSLPSPFNQDDFWSTFPEDLIADLFSSYMELAHPALFAPLHLFGILDEQANDGGGAPGRIPYTQRQVRWDRLVTMLSDPTSLPQDVYGWGATLDHDKLLRRLERVFLAFGVPAGRHIPRQSFASQYYGTAPPPDDVRELRVPLLEERRAGIGFVRAGLTALPIPPAASPSAAPVGFFIGPYTLGQASDRIELGGPFALELAGGLETGGDIGLDVRPGAVTPHLTLAGTDIDLKITFALEPQTPFFLVGDEGSSNLQLGSGSISVEAAGPVASPELKLALHLDSLSLTLDPSGGDGFVTSTIGTTPKTAQASGDLVWSSVSGFHFSGQAALKLAFPVNLTIGPVTLQSVGLEIAAGGSATNFNITVTGSLSIGPIQAVVSDIGVTLALTSVTAPARGTFGDLDIGFNFKPPSGVGLSIDAAGVSGGGFLKHDDAAHEYQGVLQLQFNNLALQAFGLITTQVAGQSGYSLLALIDADFPPVELGWGFTLNGVGGLLAVNRCGSTDALHAALKAGTLSSILFPKNAITNAPQILATLDAIFPTAQGRFLFGPMALIGWGTPTMLTAAIAIVIELPEPIRIVLIARLAARIPTESEALIRINMDALGILDFSQSSFSLDATLFDSKLIDYTLSGDMALRANWSSSQREFLLAIGGFHPQFTPPANFPALQRVTIDMPSGPVSKLRLAAYLAVSPNTLQFGATLDVFIGVSGFGLAGHLGFDALLQRSPFHFDADISGRVALTAGGDDLMSVGLDAALSGPGPWHVAGSFKIHIVFFDVTISFSHSWGEDAPAPQIAPVDVLSLLTADLADARNWGAPLPAGTPPLVSLRDPGTPVVHPLALLEVHESIVPLGLAIAQFGSAPVSGANTFTIADYQINGSTAPHEPVEDDFAPAQFFNLSDDEKLSRPSFETHDAGARLTGSGMIKCGTPVSKTISYETFYVDQPGGPLRSDTVTPLKTFGIGDLSSILAFGASGQAPIRSAANLLYRAPGNPVKIAAQSFTIVDQSTLAVSGITPQGTTYSDAKAALDEAAAQSPALLASLQIVATHEVPVT